MGKIATKTLTSTGSFVVPNGVTSVKITGNTNQTQNYFNNAKLISNSVFTSSSYAVNSDGSAWGWGNNGTGQIGNNTITNMSSPVSVVGNRSYTKISAGSNIAAAIRGSDGAAFAWGNNANGQLGDGTVTGRSSPVSVLGNISFTQISAGTCGLGIRGSDGSAWAWGANASGQVGNNTITNTSSPVSVVGNNSYTKISAGTGSLAIRGSDSSAWSWGPGASGQLGNNTVTNISSPVSVLGNISFTQIAAGNNYSMGLKTDGSAWAWGLNTNGQIGNNTVTNTSSPVSVLGNISFTQISAGGNNNAAAIRGSDGSAWCWGLGTTGLLGNNQIANNTSSPVSVAGSHSFIAISAGTGNTSALKADGSVWIWGSAGSGGLGDNETTVNQSSPIVANYTVSTFYNPKYGNKIIDRIISVTPGATVTISSIGGATLNNPTQGTFFFFNNDFIGAADSVSIEWVE